MARSKRNILAAADESSTPLDSLPANHIIMRILKPVGNNLYCAEYPTGDKTTLVEMPSRFRSSIWIKRGSLILVNQKALADRDNKLGGEIERVIMNEKLWRKQSYWPEKFCKQTSLIELDLEDEESTVGKLPPEETEED